MKKIYHSLNKKKELIALLVVCTAIFLILYHKVLWGGYMYAYKDIGSDTINSYLPRYIFDGEWIRAGNGSGYTLQYGLGSYISNPLLKYILPFNFLFVFCNSENIGLLLWISLYMKMITVALFAYLYFEKITKNKMSAFLGGLIWTFCSYMIVWGQHYQYATWIVLFTAAMYFLERFLANQRMAVLFFVVILAFMWLDSYYEVYMNGIFFAVYTIFRCVFFKYKTKIIFKKLAILLGTAFWSAALAMARLLPEALAFFSSTRGSDMVVSEAGIPWVFNKDYLLSFIARFFSANMIGIGNDFSGAYNYYEVALLSTSLLSVFAFIFLCYTKYRHRVLVIGTVGAAALIMPVVSQILNMNARKQRWSYMLCFVFVIAIVVFFSYIQKHRSEKNCKVFLKRSIILADIVSLGFLGILFIAHKYQWVTINKRVFVCVLLFVALYSFALLCCSIYDHKYPIYGIVCLVAAELIVMNYPSINSRDLIRVDEWTNGLYNDGSGETADKIKEMDSSIYRVNKSFYSVSGYNEALMQHYNGVCVYSSLNTKELVDFYTFWGYELLNGHPHYVLIPYQDKMMNDILGVKYVIADPNADMGSRYEQVFEYNGYVVYKNLDALPFGYLYDTEFLKSDIENLSDDLLQKALLYGFFITDENESGIFDLADMADTFNDSTDDQRLDELKKYSVSDFVSCENGFDASIYNAYGHEAMLVMPVIYHKNWEIYIDGQMQKVYNVNSGLTGIVIAPGEHQIHMVYKQPLYMVGNGISIIAVIVTAVLCIWMFRFRHHWKERKE